MTLVFINIGFVLFCFATLFTVISGMNYLVKNFDLLMSDDIKKNKENKQKVEESKQEQNGNSDVDTENDVENK